MLYPCVFSTLIFLSERLSVAYIICTNPCDHRRSSLQTGAEAAHLDAPVRPDSNSNKTLLLLIIITIISMIIVIVTMMIINIIINLIIIIMIIIQILLLLLLLIHIII